MKHILSIEDNFLSKCTILYHTHALIVFSNKIIEKFTQNTMLKQYNTINQLFRIITNLKTINTSNAFYAIKYFKSNNNYNYMSNNAQQYGYANMSNNKATRCDTPLSFKTTPPIANQQRNYNYRNHNKYNSNNISNERIKRAKSLKSTPIHVNKSFSSSVPLNNYNFNIFENFYGLQYYVCLYFLLSLLKYFILTSSIFDL